MGSTFVPSVNLVAGDSTMHSTLSRGESIGLALDTEAGIASAMAAMIILILIFRRIHTHCDRQYDAIDIYVISLFTGEVIQGLGHSISLKWVIEGVVNVGMVCTLQGILRQLGDLSVSLSTLAIAVQTFVTIWWLKEPNKLMAFVSAGVQWIFGILVVGINYGVHTKPPNEYYAHPVPYWCWIGPDYKRDWYYGEYAWFWLTLLVSTVLYSLLFLHYLGIIKRSRSWYAPTILADGECGKHGVEELWTVIWYPLAYWIQVMPLSIVRQIEFKEVATFGKINTSPVATLAVGIVLGLSGVVDAILYRWTRTRIFTPRRENEPQAPDVLANGERV